MTPTWTIGLVIICTIIGAFGSVFLKKGSAKNLKYFYKNKHLIIGITLYATSAILYTVALRFGDLSVLYPTVAFGYIWVILLSKKMLGEQITKYKIIAIILIFIGVSLVGLGN